MINDIPEPTLSPNFTIEDIHRIREWNYERLRNATNEERIRYYREGAVEALASMKELQGSPGI